MNPDDWRDDWDDGEPDPDDPRWRVQDDDDDHPSLTAAERNPSLLRR